MSTLVIAQEDGIFGVGQCSRLAVDHLFSEAKRAGVDRPKDGVTFFAAWKNGVVVGFATLSANRLKGLYVQPQARHLGIATALVKYRIHEARRRGFRQATAFCRPASLGIYVRLGATIRRKYKNGITSVVLELGNGKK